jgi:cell division protein FtsX
MVGKFLAALAAATLSAAPVAAQLSGTAEPTTERSDGNGLGGDVVYLVLPFLVLIALLVAITKEDEGPVSP